MANFIIALSTALIGGLIGTLLVPSIYNLLIYNSGEFRGGEVIHNCPNILFIFATTMDSLT